MTTAALQQAVALHQQGRLAEAELLYQEVLRQAPGEVNALHLLAVLRQQQGRAAEALPLFEQVLALAPDVPAVLGNYGNALKDLGRFDAAEASYRRALALAPGFVDARWNLGRLLKQRGASAEAVDCFEAVLPAEPNSVELRNELGLALREIDRLDAAIVQFRAAVALAPAQAVLHHNLGNALYRQGELDAAAASLRQALALDPSLAEPAVALGNVLKLQGQIGSALAAYDQALAAAPDHVQAQYNRGCVLQLLKRHDEAVAAFDRVLAAAPDHAQAFDARLTARLQGCDWHGYDDDLAAVRARIAAGSGEVSPFLSLVLPLAPAEQLACAKNFVAATAPARAPIFRPRPAARTRLHIAYVSADFHRHATAYLMAELFEKHDRSRFDVTGISLGPDDGSAIRARLVAGFDRFLDLRGESDAAIAERIAALGVDIAIDLKGHTKDNRFGLFAHRPAPLQVSYLGYPGPTGAEYIDYVIADATVLPLAEQPCWTERIVHLPGCYQPNDAHRQIAETVPSRAECGLPAAGFVFCCFNNSHKIAPPIFALWLRLLGQVPGSVLWLYRDNADAERRLRAMAHKQGIDPARLVFAGPVPLEAHLARHAQADLFLDTLPYNAHTTASDALWAGLPLVTCPGETFAGRVAASLLAALGIAPAADLAAYEAQALQLARDPAALAAYRQALGQRVSGAALFDGDACRRQLEAAYEEMWRRHSRGAPPERFCAEF
jgi:predicted O-linked N-acetylglucosamine transferase (SPINDLY family)